MCQVDFDHEIGNSATGNLIHPTEDNIRQERKCVNSCGIVQVKITNPINEEDIEDERGVYVEKEDLESDRPFMVYPSPESKYHKPLKNPVLIKVTFDKVIQSANE